MRERKTRRKDKKVRELERKKIKERYEKKKRNITGKVQQSQLHFGDRKNKQRKDFFSKLIFLYLSECGVHAILHGEADGLDGEGLRQKDEALKEGLCETGAGGGLAHDHGAWGREGRKGK